MAVTSAVNMHLGGKQVYSQPRSSPATEVKESCVSMGELGSFLLVPLLKHRQGMYRILRYNTEYYIICFINR